MTAKQTWVDGRVEVLLAALQELGLSASRTAAADLIRERVGWVSSQTGISPAAARRYLTDEAVQGLAHTMAFAVVQETPGADILDAPRTAAVSMAMVGRCVAGLAEASRIRLYETDDIDHVRVTVSQLAQALSAIGQITATAPDHGRRGSTADAELIVMMPPGLVHRAARYLDAAATLVADGVLPDGVDPIETGHLAAALRRDAANLRSYATD
jgi:hypothetical protein